MAIKTGKELKALVRASLPVISRKGYGSRKTSLTGASCFPPAEMEINMNTWWEWNPNLHTNEENLQWSWLRAIEWGNWPAFISSPIVPLLLPFFVWWKVIGAIVILTILWATIRYRFVNLTLAGFGVYFVLLKWITLPLALIYLILNHNYILAIFSFLWSGLGMAVVCGVFVGGSQTGRIQKMFMEKLEYRHDELLKQYTRIGVNEK